jgi:hypothetical protein
MINPKIPNRRFVLKYIKITKIIGFVNFESGLESIKRGGRSCHG